MSLKEFHADKHTQADLKAFMFQVLDEEALERVYKGQDTASLKEARKLIEKSFKKLDELFTPKPKPRKRDRAV